MTRGRRADNYPREEFRRIISDRRKFLGFTLEDLEIRTDIHRGTLSAILQGKRGCPTEGRRALIGALRLGEEAEERFVNAFAERSHVKPLVPLDPPISPHPPLEAGQLFLACSCYPEAYREFLAVFQMAANDRNHVLQADSAARLSWLYDEMGHYDRSFKWAAESVRLIETSVGASFGEIMESVRPGSHSSLCTSNQEASHVLTRALQTRARVFVQRVMYDDEGKIRAKAEKALAHTHALLSHLQIPSAIGHDLGWQAAFLSSSRVLDRKAIEKFLDASQEIFPHGSYGDAYLARSRGIVGWQSELLGQTHQSLLKAVHGLASFADARALGPTFYVLSKETFQRGGDMRTARRYALAGAVLHPYSFVLRNAREHVRHAPEPGLRRDIDDVFCGHKPFDVLEPVLSRLVRGTGISVQERMRKNLSRILGDGRELPR